MSTLTRPENISGAAPPAPGTATDLLIIGSSQSGVQLAVSLRALGWDGHITLLGDEDHRPYQRPALSKDYLQGKSESDSLIFRTEEYWVQHHVTVVRRARVTDLQQLPDGSGTAVCADGQRFEYSRLALTVGASPRRLEVPGAELPGVLYLRQADDAIALRAAAPEAEDVVVVGAGFIGLEAAASLHAMGKRVTVLETGSRILRRAVGEQTSDHILNHHLAEGIDVILGAQVAAIVPDEQGRAARVRLVDGRTLEAQIVLVGIGVVPNTGLASSLGLEVDNGIVVDRNAVASDGRTLAIGDVANLPNPMPGALPGDRVRLESVNNAIEQAKVAAYSVVDRRQDYEGIPWFWSNQGGLRLQIAGLCTGYDTSVVRRDPAKDKFTVLYYRGGALIAADCINAPLDFMAVRSALAAGKTIPPASAADPAVPLKTLITSGHATSEDPSEEQP